MLMMGFNLKSFRNMIRPFLTLPDANPIIIVLTLLIQHQVIRPKEHMTLKDLIRATSWLKGTAGREALANLQLQKKLQKKSHNEMFSDMFSEEGEAPSTTLNVEKMKNVDKAIGVEFLS